MKTVKEILSENRDSVISSIKYIFKVWKSEDVKVKMVEFLAFAETCNVEALNDSKRIKTDLKFLVQKMAGSQRREREEARNMRMFGTKNPKLADIMAYGAEVHEARGEKWDPLAKDWVKA